MIGPANMKKFIIYNLKFLIIFLFGLALAPKASAAILYSQAANQDVYEGQTFVVDWFLDTENQTINSIDLGLNFSRQIISAEDVNSGNSLVNIWIQYPKADNNAGKIQLTGGIPGGVRGAKIPIFRSTFSALSPGNAFIALDPASKVLLNDGQGTETILKYKNLEFNVYPKNFIPAALSSPTHPDSTKWYKTGDVEIKFDPKEGVDYSYSFSSNIEITPGNEKQETNGDLWFKNLEDGVYYFKLNTKVGPSNWQEAGVYRVQIDRTSPVEFTPAIGSDPSLFGGNKFVSFSTVDKTSGISHYNIKIGLFGRTYETQSPAKLYKPIIGDNITVTAFDNAGNAREVSLLWPGIISVKVFEIFLILIGLIAIGYGFLGLKAKKKHKT